MIGDLAFTELWSLQELYLDSNEIEFISERGFGGLIQLRKLSIADNKLGVIDNNVFGDVKKLNVLDLRNNELETLIEEVMQNVIENFKSNYAFIALGGNKLHCDCSLSWLHKLSNETRSRRVKTALARLSCISDIKLPITNYSKSEKIIDSSHTLNSMTYKKSFEKMYDEGEGNIEDDPVYEDTLQDQETEIPSNKIEYRRKLLQIPAEMLPCPSKYSFEASFSPPTQDEVKYYKSSSSRVTALVTYLMTIIFNLT
ncbi:unnamed protein product [Parnassius apollo]|uniref:(apollo) hypothetical protein n=1 Tax=Parnassius apollo TaxID=110799 RepID=A0A8S3WGJ8_PARAO|nr:unnamed protein product [Parnassius apollo]